MWAEHVRTKRSAPLERDRLGTFAVIEPEPGRYVYGSPEELERDGHPTVLRYVNHYATCPDAPAWRARGGAR